MADQKQNQSFTKVDQLRPLASGLNLTVKVISAKTVAQKNRDGAQLRPMTECLVGDETGIIIFKAKNDQADLMKEGNTVILHKARVDLFRGSMRLMVDRSDNIEKVEKADFSVKEDNNLSLIEFERVDVVV